MKTILLDGCSFVAGDAIAWDIFKPEQSWKSFLMSEKAEWTEEFAKTKTDYVSFRKLHNLGGQLGKITGAKIIDLAIDGSANRYTAMRVISHLSRLPSDERKNYHVCIGWSGFRRYYKWAKAVNRYVTLHHITANNSHALTDIHKELGEYLNSLLLYNYDTDLVLNYVCDIMFLENFLIANDVTYTFWRSIGDEVVPHVANEATCQVGNKGEFTDHKRWLTLVEGEVAWRGSTWHNLLTPNDFVYDNNQHPNLSAATKMATLISTHIQPLL